MPQPVDVDDLRERLLDAGYVADDGLATALACAVSLERAVLLEGDAGVGKTDAARALAAVHDAQLLRLQCYEGLDLASAAYDWNYGKQLLAIRAAEAAHERTPDLYADDFLIRRPLLAALGAPRERGIVLLIDEIDRADDEFEAFLLEFLSDFAISIPERGTIAARHRPIVVLTSNRTRDLHDALKRRCFYHWIAHPTISREIAILRMRVPEAPPALAADVARAAAALRERDLRKPPGIAESLDWTQTLQLLGADRLDHASFQRSLGAVLKYPEDIETARAAAEAIVAAVRADGVA
ncbi:MoxR-like ATPase [Vulcanimicrobium alpinum]|uniref:MoxR-like ATPase n=1 Tax=Vulcanimicrobium alpinum TaxID=3016050 RepID=A0AAN1XWI9_UNVUL|nr:MoxR family ATPase [Vulcanimicrobium alpinum]BDE05841.1 MoxR-like ATPase [Vulcanimicrobium alpinum]